MKHRFASQSSFLADDYTAFFETANYTFVQGHAHADSGYWFNTLILEDREHRERDDDTFGLVTDGSFGIVYEWVMR